MKVAITIEVGIFIDLYIIEVLPMFYESLFYIKK